jgi:single-stranded-DNA-specific exonuclease
MAAGLTVTSENVENLKASLRQIAERELSDLDLVPELRVDMELPLSYLNWELLNSIDNLEPTGHKNRGALFVSRKVEPRSIRAIGNEGKHLKFSVKNERGYLFDAICFNQGFLSAQMPPTVDLLYSFEKNSYQGRESLQLNVRDIKPSLS